MINLINVIKISDYVTVYFRKSTWKYFFAYKLKYEIEL